MSLRIKVTKLDKLNTLIFKQEGGRFFISAQDSFIIDVLGFAMLIKFLVFNGYLSHKVLRGILEEYDSFSSLDHRKD